MRLSDLMQFFTTFFNTPVYPPAEQGGIFYPSDARPNSIVERVGLALEPWPGLVNWLVENRIDTLWLHRPWKLDRTVFPTNVMVLSHHLPFDEHLTMGFNQLLANALGLEWTDADGPAVIGYKEIPGFPKRPIGMCAVGAALDFEGWCRRITEQFGGYDEAVPGQSSPGSQNRRDCLAVVGAMNDELIRQAADRGAKLYITGQYRKAAQKTVVETGLAVIAVGHRRSEEWGLRALSEVLKSLGLTVSVMTV